MSFKMNFNRSMNSKFNNSLKSNYLYSLSNTLYELKGHESTENNNLKTIILISLMYAFSMLSNIIIIVYFTKKVNPRSTNRAFIIAISTNDFVHILLSFIENVIFSYNNIPVLCELDTFLVSVIKNLTAGLLIASILNSIVRLHFGSYTIGVQSFHGQVCSKLSLVITLLCILSTSSYNLWRKTVQNKNCPFDEIECCSTISSYDSEVFFFLENIILVINYIILITLTLILTVLYICKKNNLRCHIKRDKKIERDMVLSLILIAFVTSILQIIQIFESFNNYDNSLQQLTVIINQYLLQNKLNLSNGSRFDKGLISIIRNEYLGLISATFKVFVFCYCITKIRKKLFFLFRIKCRLNPNAVIRDKRKLFNEQKKLVVIKKSKNEIRVCSFEFRKI